MKKIATLCLLVIAAFATNAQTVNIENSRKIATKGYAEKEITPDIIYLSINAKEYYQDGNQKKKISIENIEKEIYNATKIAGVKKEDITIQNIFSYNPQNKKKNNEILQARQYRVKVTNLNGLNTMLDNIDPQALQSTSIDGYDHSKKREIEKELKTLAVKDARNNAEILAAADRQVVGQVLAINDNSYFNFNDLMPQTRVMYAKYAMADMAPENGESLNIDIRPIKINCTIDCIFAIQ